MVTGWRALHLRYNYLRSYLLLFFVQRYLHKRWKRGRYLKAVKGLSNMKRRGEDSTGLHWLDIEWFDAVSFTVHSLWVVFRWNTVPRLLKGVWQRRGSRFIRRIKRNQMQAREHASRLFTPFLDHHNIYSLPLPISLYSLLSFHCLRASLLIKTVDRV